jgi:hypothetical protein
VLSRTEVGLSGTTFLDPSEVLLLGELMLLAGSSARMECKYFVAYILSRFGYYIYLIFEWRGLKKLIIEV